MHIQTGFKYNPAECTLQLSSLDGVKVWMNLLQSTAFPRFTLYHWDLLWLIDKSCMLVVSSENGQCSFPFLNSGFVRNVLILPLFVLIHAYKSPCVSSIIVLPVFHLFCIYLPVKTQLLHWKHNQLWLRLHSWNTSRDKLATSANQVKEPYNW